MGNWCLHASTLIIAWVFVKLAGNQDRHKISFEFKFWPDQTSHLIWSYLPLIVEKGHRWHCSGHSPFIFYRIFMKVAHNLSRHKISHVFKIWPEWTICFGVTCLDCWKDHIWLSGHVGLRWAIVALWATLADLSMVRRPSVVVVRRRPHFQIGIFLRPVSQSWSDLIWIIIWVGKRQHNVLGQIGSELWFPRQPIGPIDL